MIRRDEDGPLLQRHLPTLEALDFPFTGGGYSRREGTARGR